MSVPSAATVRLAAGAGLVARRPTALLYVPDRDAALIEAFTASPPGAELQAVASTTVAAGFTVGPYVCLAWGSGVQVMAFGDIAVETDQPTLPMLSGAGSRTWVEHSLPLNGDAVIEVGGAGDVDASTDLAGGVVLAGGFRLELAAAAPAQAPAPPAPEPAAVPEARRRARHGGGARARRGGTGPAAWAARRSPDAGRRPRRSGSRPGRHPGGRRRRRRGAPAANGRRPPPSQQPSRSPLTSPTPTIPTSRCRRRSRRLLDVVPDLEPADSRGTLVDAKMCGNGHPNPPAAATCGVCGEFLAPGSSSVLHVPRPSLGGLQLDDGQVVELDQELLIGRRPERDSDPARQGLRPVTLTGDKVSRSHLEVRFQGWEVLVADCGSTNGTFVVPHPGGQVVALEPGRPQIVEPGATVYFGSRSFTVLGRRRVTDLRLRVDFIGEVTEVEPGEELTFGRQADLHIDDNRHLHRVLGRFWSRGDAWWLTNEGRADHHPDRRRRLPIQRDARPGERDRPVVPQLDPSLPRRRSPTTR